MMCMKSYLGKQEHSKEDLTFLLNHFKLCNYRIYGILESWSSCGTGSYLLAYEGTNGRVYVTENFYE
jgi:hypothetical protein